MGADFADVLQIPVDVIEGRELGAQGAAIAAGIASGVYQNYQEAVERTVGISRTVEPRSEYKQIYEEKYMAYRAVIDALGSSGTWKYFKN